jgi:hypothetical protein
VQTVVRHRRRVGTTIAARRPVWMMIAAPLRLAGTATNVGLHRVGIATETGTETGIGIGIDVLTAVRIAGLTVALMPGLTAAQIGVPTGELIVAPTVGRTVVPVLGLTVALIGVPIEDLIVAPTVGRTGVPVLGLTVDQTGVPTGDLIVGQIGPLTGLRIALSPSSSVIAAGIAVYVLPMATCLCALDRLETARSNAA